MSCKVGSMQLAVGKGLKLPTANCQLLQFMRPAKVASRVLFQNDVWHFEILLTDFNKFNNIFLIIAHDKPLKL
jgi:hypothetical protein